MKYITIYDRLWAIRRVFIDLEHTPSTLDKERIIEDFRSTGEQLSKDITYAFEILSGQHKIGFTINAPNNGDIDKSIRNSDLSLEEFLRPIYEMTDHTAESISSIEKKYAGFGIYINPLLNREWRVGINKSQVAVKDTSPMLAKKFSFEKLPGTETEQKFETYFITEKLDGNRCIAKYNVQLNKWEFFSRSGKLLKVNFDMMDMPTIHIYDGEILSYSQLNNPSQENFNVLSGALNSKYGNKDDLVYMIFDIVDVNTRYDMRRTILDNINGNIDDSISRVRILPVLATASRDNVFRVVEQKLKEIESKGGEGVMVNLGSRYYTHKRTDSLLKVKSTYTMDMRVVDILPGTGKYKGLVGSLLCVAVDDIDKVTEYVCQVGSGLGDYERLEWALQPSKILNKIVEVAYFSLSQDVNKRGTPTYSLRFPRFKGIRYDKNDTSIY